MFSKHIPGLPHAVFQAPCEDRCLDPYLFKFDDAKWTTYVYTIPLPSHEQLVGSFNP